MNRELNSYKSMVADMFTNVSQAIGIHVMVLVIEQALWKTKFKYKDAELISFSEEGINLDSLDALDPQISLSILKEFIMAMVSVLGRLVGIQLAQQLTEQLHSSIKGGE